MIFNEKLINPKTDGEIYSEACPTLATLTLAHYSTPNPAQHNPIVYGADGLFFATFPNRRLYLRPAFRNEFDLNVGEASFIECPKLWVLVSHLSDGVHEITPRWRGKPFWKELDTDKAVAQTLIVIAVRGGLALSEWQGYVQDRRISNAYKATPRNKRREN